MASRREEGTVLIYVQTIPHKSQRYETCGDWRFIDGLNLHVSVSETGNRQSNLLVGLHEIIEAILCESGGISGESVDMFDIAFEEARQPGNLDEPGNDPRAPYRRQHLIAELVERLVAMEAGVNWEDHCKRVESL